MSEESSNNGSQWSEGGPTVETMDGAAVNSEIKQIESHPSYIGENTMGHWPRQRMIRRISDLYAHESFNDPEREQAAEADRGDMHQTLSDQGITVETLEADTEKFEARDWKEELKKSRQELERRFGGETEAKVQIKHAKAVLDRFGSAEDRTFIDSSGLGNSVQFIEALAKVGKMLEKARRKK